MDTKLRSLVLFACIASCHACQPAKPISPPQVEKGIETIRGTVRLREAVKLPPNASLRIVVRWYDQLITSQSAKVETWPASFAIAIKWPNGSKGSPGSHVNVSAWADVNGEPFLVSDTQACGYDEVAKPMQFLLIPVRE